MRSLIARLLFLSGCILLLFGTIYGVFALFSGQPLFLFVGLIIGLSIIGLSEIIDKVNQINQKLDELIEDKGST